VSVSPDILRRIEVLEREADVRHESNITRFEQLSIRVAAISGELRIIIGLLFANGAINIYSVWHK